MVPDEWCRIYFPLRDEWDEYGVEPRCMVPDLFSDAMNGAA